jgi:type IV pilus assembly protein PilM
MRLFHRKSHRQVGIDVGTSSIKVAVLAKEGSHLELLNYGIIYGLDFLGKNGPVPANPAPFRLTDEEIAAAIRKLLEFSKIKTASAVLTVPIFSSFLTIIELPAMPQGELERAVQFASKSYIPVPLSEVVLDWVALPPRETSITSPVRPAAVLTAAAAAPIAPSVLQDRPLAPPTQTISVLLVAVPKEMITKYEHIASLCGLSLAAVESESFSMVRSLVGNDPSTVMLIDCGARSTTLTIIDNGYVKMSHSVDLSGKEITDTISKGLNISSERAEALKRSEGIAARGNTEGVSRLIVPLLERLISEYQKMTSFFDSKEGRRIDKIILTGGSATLPGLAPYLSEKLGRTVTLGNPFARVRYPDELKSILTAELAATLTVAIGAAMRDFE